MNVRSYFPICILALLAVFCGTAAAQPARRPQAPAAISNNVLLSIIRHEDGRRWDDQLKELLADSDPNVRTRAALAAGRIGDDRAVPILTDMLLADKDSSVRDMAAFALGEIESAGGAYALV